MSMSRVGGVSDSVLFWVAKFGSLGLGFCVRIGARVLAVGDGFLLDFAGFFGGLVISEVA